MAAPSFSPPPLPESSAAEERPRKTSRSKKPALIGPLKIVAAQDES